MATNIGGMLGPVAIGLCVGWWGYPAGFAVAGAAKVLTLVSYLAGRRHMAEHTAPPEHARNHRRWRLGGLAGIAVTVVACTVLLGQPVWAGWILLAACIAAGAAYVVMMLRESVAVRRRLLAHLVVVVGAVVFWAIYQQFTASVLIYTDDDVQRRLLHWLVPATFFNSLNPAFVLLLSPLFVLLWRRAARRDREPHDFFKLGAGVTIAGLAFWLLSLGIIVDDTGVRTAVGWVLGFQFLLAVGEMLVGPVGLTLTTTLAPRHLASFAMGIWYLSTAAAYYLSGVLADFVAAKGKPSLALFEGGFSKYGLIGVLGGVAVLVVAPRLRRLAVPAK